MRKDPAKYSSLIYNNKTSNADYNSKCYTASYMYGQQQCPAQAYMDMLIEEAQQQLKKKQFNKLTKEIGDEIITDYSSNISSSLPFLQTPFDGKEQQQPKPLVQRLPAAEEANQPTYMECPIPHMGRFLMERCLGTTMIVHHVISSITRE
jgi:hypothetical protein